MYINTTRVVATRIIRQFGGFAPTAAAQLLQVSRSRLRAACTSPALSGASVGVRPCGASCAAGAGAVAARRRSRSSVARGVCGSAVSAAGWCPCLRCFGGRALRPAPSSALALVGWLSGPPAASRAWAVLPPSCSPLLRAAAGPPLPRGAVTIAYEGGSTAPPAPPSGYGVPRWGRLAFPARSGVCGISAPRGGAARPPGLAASPARSCALAWAVWLALGRGFQGR